MSHAFSTHRNEAGSETNLSVGNVKAADFVGGGMAKWKTGSVVNLYRTFYQAIKMDANFGGWDVSKVGSLRKTFDGAQRFTGSGLDTWKTGSVTNLERTFSNANNVNVNLKYWDTSKVTAMTSTFYNAYRFVGDGLDQWDVAKVTSLDNIFLDATALTSCSKRQIADAWKTKVVFTDTSYDTDWANDTCVAAQLSDAQFKQASWGTSFIVTGSPVLTALHCSSYPENGRTAVCVEILGVNVCSSRLLLH
jgi:hypothetical protein